MSSYDLALDMIQEGRVHAKIRDIVEFLDKNKEEEQYEEQY